MLSEYYFGDPRLVLVPIEHLTPAGVSEEFAAAVAAARGWEAARIALLGEGFARYWQRTAELARRASSWAPPRRRHIAVLAEPFAVHPYATLLNSSAWTLYAEDLDPRRSHPELVAFLLALGDRMAVTGEVTAAALLHAAWWFERSDAECAAFAAAAAASTRPDADALRALAGALPWLRTLRHETLRPAPAAGHRAIPGSGLLVPDAAAAGPPALVERWTGVAHAAVATYRHAWRATDPRLAAALLDWLAVERPPLLVSRAGRIVWDPRDPQRHGALRSELKRCSAAALRDVHADLLVVARHTRRFLASLAAPDALAAVDPAAEQSGYTYMHRSRGLLVYDLDEPGIDRRQGPALPFARAMLGARAVHEWAHRAVDAGWVPRRLDDAAYGARVDAFAAALDDTIAAAAPALRRATAADLQALLASEPGAASPGAALARLVERRMADFQSNLLAARYLDLAERETYVRQNIRTLRAEYPPPRRWRLLIRYLYEIQYLRFSAVAERRAFFVDSTWCDADLFDSGALSPARFDALAAMVAALCDAYAVDESRFR